MVDFLERRAKPYQYRFSCPTPILPENIGDTSSQLRNDRTPFAAKESAFGRAARKVRCAGGGGGTFADAYTLAGVNHGEAALAHLTTVVPILEQMPGMADLTRLEVNGPLLELDVFKPALVELNPAWFETACGVTGVPRQRPTH